MKNLFLFFCLLSFLACSKDDDLINQAPDCERQNFAELSVYNNHQDPYLIYVNGSLIRRIPGQSSAIKIKISPVYSQFKAVQESGYLFFPTEYNNSYQVDQCDQITWTIP